MRFPLILTVMAAMVAIASPTPAINSPPSPANSTVPACISLVGSAGAIPADSFGSFSVTYRDLANNPVVGAAIVIDLSQCPDLHLCADQLDPNATVNCLVTTVTKLTGIDGMARFTVLGGSNGGPAISLLNGGRIYANGVLIGSPTVSAFDLDGAGGVGVNDLSAWLGDFGSLQPYGRGDFDCNGSVGINDLSVWLKALGSHTQLASCASTCP